MAWRIKRNQNAQDQGEFFQWLDCEKSVKERVSGFFIFRADQPISP